MQVQVEFPGVDLGDRSPVLQVVAVASLRTGGIELTNDMLDANDLCVLVVHQNSEFPVAVPGGPATGNSLWRRSIA